MIAIPAVPFFIWAVVILTRGLDRHNLVYSGMMVGFGLIWPISIPVLFILFVRNTIRRINNEHA